MTNRRWRPLFVALFSVVAVLGAPAGSNAAEYPDDTVYEDDLYPYPEDTVYEGDPSLYPDDTVYEDEFYTEDLCDPAYHPDPASDPYCTPEVTTPGAAPATTTLEPRSAASPLSLSALANNGTPLIDVDTGEAPIVGAGRMLLAIDAIAELAGFERAITPGGATLLREIREGIPAEGLDDEGYAQELETFIADFLPFLESLEHQGVVVSDSLWEAAEGLEDSLSGDPDDFALLEPRPWMLGIADLLVRGGEAAAIASPAEDEEATRELLAAFAVVSLDPAPATSTTTISSAPESLALQSEDTSVIDQPSDDAGPILLIGAGGGVLALTFASLVLARRRAKRTSPAVDPADARDAAGLAVSSVPSAGVPTGGATSRASVSQLLDASRRMSASLDTNTIASIALAEATRIVDAEGGLVVRRIEAGLDPVGCEPPMLFNYDHIADGCLPRVVETGQSIALIAHDEPLLVNVPMAVAAVPIVADGTVTGAILVVRVSARPFDREELDALEMLAPLAGSAFAVADEHEERIDVEPLTGLQNRRRLDLDLASISTDDEVAYVMVDIDHFKNFNDTNGHAAGDEALRRVSAILQASVRPNDLVYRYGGEEFCVLLPATSAEEAVVVAERARAAVAAAHIPGMENQPTGTVTISIGVSDSAFGMPSDLVERADAALYESKRNGRNRVTLSSAE